MSTRRCAALGHPPATGVVAGDPRRARGRPRHRARGGARRRTRRPATTSASGRGRSDGCGGRPCRRTATTAAVEAISSSAAHCAAVDARWAGVGRDGARHTGSCCRTTTIRSRSPASTTPSAVHRMPRSASTVRACQSVPTTSRWIVASSPCGVMHRVDVGRRTADVDDEHVAAARRRRAPRRRAARHPAWGPRTSSANPRPRDSPLPPMTWREEGLADGGARRLRRDDPDRGSTLSVTTWRRPVDASRAADLVARVGVAGDDDRGADEPWPLASRSALCSSTSALPPSVPPTSSTRSGASRPQRGDVGAGHRPARDVHDLGAGRQARPGARPRRSPRARSRRRRAAALPRRSSRRSTSSRLAVRRERGAHGVHAVHDVGRRPSSGWLAVPSTVAVRRRRAPPW